MTANWPDDPGPAYSKYLSYIPMDRLNKAPIITINSFKNDDYNSVSVRLSLLRADEGAGDTLKAGVYVDSDQGPGEAVWGKYYDPATVNSAPVISMSADPLSFDKHYISSATSKIPLDLPTAKAILGDVAPDPSRYQYRYMGRLNQAPVVKAMYGGSDENSAISVDTCEMSLNIYAADEMLRKYQK